jgi:putative two-component system hydrogenase maturation factor HypX/HoxX
MGPAEAVESGLADERIAGDPAAFLEACIERAAQLADDFCWSAFLEAKRAARGRDEAAKPLERYRVEELARMKLNFYGFDPSYHVARYHFVYKLPKARTPHYLASPAVGSATLPVRIAGR